MNASPDQPDDAQAPNLTQASILIVDDNLQNLELMQAYLEELGCSISTATDGLEAIEAIDAAKPVNKLELLTKVQSLLEHRMLLRSCDQLGLQDHVPKPDFRMLTDEGDTILPPPEDEEFEGESPRAPRF